MYNGEMVVMLMKVAMLMEVVMLYHNLEKLCPNQKTNHLKEFHDSMVT
jgi:hypothetical protein